MPTSYLTRCTPGEFPQDVTAAELAAGFVLTTIAHPDPEKRAQTPLIRAVVRQIDEYNRVVKRCAPSGEVVYQHRRRAGPEADAPPGVPTWRDVFLPFLEPATAVRIATVNRAVKASGEK